MKYVSTRGFGSVESAKAITDGLAPDGGLYIPETIPTLSAADFEQLRRLDYVGRAENIISRYLTDYTQEETRACVKGAYTVDAFGSDLIVPLHRLSDRISLLELWHGPTCAFKDLALQILPHLLTTGMKKQGEDRTVVILVATSGDTGKAALEGFCDVPGCRILVFYPTDGVSDIQKLQMTTQLGGNVRSCGIRGNFDDAQNGVKRMFSDPVLRDSLDKKGFFLSSANSINWGRLVPQIVYYVDAYLKALDSGAVKPGGKVNICVPTGNFGNILAAWFAYQMGLPVDRFICASNANNVLTDFIDTGVYDRRREFHTTISPSMDILVSSNLERMLYLACTGDSEAVRSMMASLSGQGHYEAPDCVKRILRNKYDGMFCNDDDTMAQIRQTYDEFGYVCDTHTAVALSAARRYTEQVDNETPVLVASTASPYKFAGSVLKALGRDFDGDGFEKLERLSSSTGTECPGPLATLKSRPVRFPGVRDTADMQAELEEFVAG